MEKVRVVKANVSTKGKDSINIKINNGMRDFIVEIKKENISFENIENNNVEVKVYSMIRNCCASCPIYVLESGKSIEEDNEISQLLKDIITKIGTEMKELIA